MKKILFLDGGLRHIAGYLGVFYIFFAFLAIINAVPKTYNGWSVERLFNESGLPQALTIGFLIAVFIEMLQNRKTKGYNSFSVPDIITSVVGVFLGVSIFILIGGHWLMCIVACAMIAFAYFDYKTAFVKDKFKK